jgi:hypothetical protein
VRTPVIMIVLAAATPLAATFAAEPSGQPERPRLVCRTAQKTTGSHIRAPRRCHSAEEWQRIDREAGQIPVSLQLNASKNDGTQTRPQ